MTLTYGFYNSVAGDRVYNAEQVSSLFDGLIGDGVYASIGDYLIVSADSGMNVNVGTGRAWFNHTWTLNDAVLGLTLDTAHVTLPRIDIIALEVNAETSDRANSIIVVKGTPASNPVAPTLTNAGNVHQYPLAHILVGAGVTEINQGNITNKVGTADCPFVTGIISTVNTDDLLVQWEAEFQLWFDNVVNELSEEQFGNLQNQINQHDHSEELNTQVVAGGIANDAVDDTKIGNRVPKLIKRQAGANANEWGTSFGTTNYTVTNVKQQPGFISITIPAGSYYAELFVTYPEAFDYSAIVLITPYHVTQADVHYVVVGSYYNGFNFRATRLTNTGDLTVYVFWLAIGPG